MAKFRIPLLNSLPAFEAAARLQSFKGACEELHVTAASVSRHIKNLELKLGCRLFKRSHKRVELTESGAMLFAAVGNGFSQIHRAFAQLSGHVTPDRLVISVDPDFAALWLVPRLAEFYALVPTTMVEVLSERMSSAFHDPRVSFAIHYAPARSRPRDSELLFRSRLFPVCAKTLFARSPIRTSRDLRGHVLLHDRSIAEWEEYHHRTSARVPVDLDRGMIFNNTVMCLEAAARGQGVALGDDYLAATFLSEGRLVKPLSASVLSKNSYFLVVSGGAAKHRAVNAFRDWLVESIASQRQITLAVARTLSI